MRTETNTGWRKLGPIFHAPDAELEASKDELFAAMRLAVSARRLRPSARHLLDHLVGCYGGAKIKDRFLVWPSNEFLMERTGLVERSIRYALAELVKLGLIEARESANGKRFAIRAANGQIIDAYGFDLTPLLLLKDQHQAAVDRLQTIRRLRDLSMDQITICRRAAREILLALDEWSAGSAELWARFEQLVAHTPRRDSQSPIEAAVASWDAFRSEVTALYNAASGGNSCRHIENNKDAPDQSCSNGSEMEGRRPPEVKLSDVLEACPDAIAYADSPTRPEHLMNAAARLRGGFGVHESAWFEAVQKLGVAAGAVFFVALQVFENDRRGKATMTNFGGYFRTFARRVAAGEIKLAAEVFEMKRKRWH